MSCAIGQIAISLITINTYLSACMNQAPCVHCTMHKDGICEPGLNCYFAITAWFIGAGYILGRN